MKLSNLLAVTLLSLAACDGSGGSGGIPAGTGTITGSVASHALSTVKAAYVIGQADDSSGTTVVYVFDAAVTCDELTSAGWDSRIADRTGVVEMKLIGKTAGSFPASGAIAQSGQSSVNFTLSSRAGKSMEQSASAGAVQLDKLLPDGSAEGSFNLTFGTEMVKGTFSAALCSGGHEP